jgi:general secretion pathway protein C
VEWLLRRNYWIVRLVGGLVVTALAANTATTLLTFYLLSGASGTSPAAKDADADDDAADTEELAVLGTAAATPRNDRARQAERNAERILGYSPFCPGCAPTTTAPGEETMPSPVAPGTTGAQRTQLPLVVAATMEADDPTRSLATVVDTTAGVGGLFGVGDHLGFDIEIVAVATGVVHIRNAGRLEYIPFDGLPVGPPPQSTLEQGTGKGKGKGTADAVSNERSIPGAQEAIQCSGKGDCVVERAFVEKLLSEPKLLVGQGGATPATTKDGVPGFRLRGVRKGTLPDLLGLQNGDVITEVGGSPLTMDVLPGLYGKLRHASHVEVTVDRRGERVSRQLEIRS